MPCLFAATALAATALAAPCGVSVADNRIPGAEAALAFRTGSAELTEASEVALQGLTCLLEADRGLTIQIEAHTDARGASIYNQRVSQERANAIRDALIARGADADRLTAVGYGELVPLDSNQTAEGRANNRRIELHTVPPSQRPPPPEPPPPPVEPVPGPRAPAPGPVDVCLQARLLRPDRRPSWPGASCSGEPWGCLVPLAFDDLAGQLQACFEGVLRDGDEVFFPVHGATATFRRAPGGTRITMER